MSRPPQHENGAYGANPTNGAPGAQDAHGSPGADGSPPFPPNVYVPPAAPAPAYDEYADPATAHGWQNAYDETQQLPQLPAEAAPEPSYGVAADDVGQGGPGGRRPAGGRRGSRRKPGPWRSRRAAVAAGALGAVSAAALIAAYPFGGSGAPGDSPGGAEGKDGGRTSPTATEDASGSGSPDAPTSPADGTGTGASASPTASPGTSAPEDGSEEETSPTSSSPKPTTAPASTATATEGPGNSDDKPGKGGGRGPR